MPNNELHEQITFAVQNLYYYESQKRKEAKDQMSLTGLR